MLAAHSKSRAKKTSIARFYRLLSIPPIDAHDLIMRGVDLQLVASAANRFGITDAELTRLLGIQGLTVNRRAESGGRLSVRVAGRFYRLGVTLLVAKTTFGSIEAAMRWLRAEQRALNYRTPFEVMRSVPGAVAVSDLLGRIERGVVT